MLESLIPTIITCLCTSVVSGLVAWGVASLKTKTLETHEKSDFEKKKSQAMELGISTILRKELKDIYQESMSKGSIDIEQLGYAESVYNAYHALGGNGIGTKIFEDIKKIRLCNTGEGGK